MQFDPVLIASRQKSMTANGYWRQQTINQFMAQALHRCPSHLAIVGHRSDMAQPVRLSYQQLDQKVDRIARGLVALGVGHSDVVSWQLPNWWEFIALALACARIGAVANPIMPIFRQRELKFMLDFGESKVFIVPKSYKGFDYELMVNDMRGDLPFLKQLIVLNGEGANSFESLLMRDDTPSFMTAGLAPDDVLLLMYTSGTTGEPKGVMHTSNTLFANLHAFIETYGLTQKDVILGASPMAHLTGFGYLAMIPIILNATTVLQDIWEPNQALELIRDENITFSMASSPFVADLLSLIHI